MDDMAFQALWRLGKLKPEQVVEQAVAWLSRGLDGPHLRELAWRQDSVFEIEALMTGALREVGLSVMSEGEARMWCARQLAQRIVEGELDPYDGACRIYWECWEFEHESCPASVRQFYWLSIDAELDALGEFIPTPELRARIRTYAAEFLESGQPAV